MDFQQYLKRIGLEETPDVSLQSLMLLQKKHLFAVPFENLDIHIGRRIIIDYERIYEKIVLNKRGGFCYELNGLFYFLLQHLGFSVKRLSAIVDGDIKEKPLEYDHMTLLVTIDGQEWLTDVGFGRFSFTPLKLELETLQSDGRHQFKYAQYNEEYYGIMALQPDDTWKFGYIFTKKERQAYEFIPMCHYQQTFPESHFVVKGKMITIPTKEGRITLHENNLKITKGREVSETAVEGDEHYFELLKEHFGITLHY